jgi:hypothetical protein
MICPKNSTAVKARLSSSGASTKSPIELGIYSMSSQGDPAINTSSTMICTRALMCEENALAGIAANVLKAWHFAVISAFDLSV